MLAHDKRKREIAHALSTSYSFYGTEKVIVLEVHPLLVELVKYAKEIQNSLALAENGSTKEKTGELAPVLSYGGPYTTLLELPSTLLEILKEGLFRNLDFA